MGGGVPYKNTLIIYKNGGKFYYALDTDAYILSLIFGYKVINNKCGFPDNAIEKNTQKLNEVQINYQIVFSNKNPIRKNFKKLNKYEEYNNEALRLINIEKNLGLFEAKMKNSSEEELVEILRYINEKL